MMHNVQLPAFPGPQIAGPARADAPFVAAGRRALATGWAATGVAELWIHPFRVLRRLRVDGASSAHSARLTPTGFERRFVLDGREVLERVFVPAAAPAVVVEWALLPPLSASAACLEPLDLELVWECDLARGDASPGADASRGGEAAPALRGYVSARRVTVERAPGPSESAGAGVAFSGGRAFAASVEPLRPTRGRPSPGLGCRLGVRLVPGEHFALLVSAPADEGPGKDGGEPEIDLAALVAARAADAQRRAAERLALSATDPLAGQALRWAALRLPAYLAELGGAAPAQVAAGYAPGAPPRPSAGAALRVGLASLALGDPALAMAAARSALADAEAAARGRAAGGAPTSAATRGLAPVPPGTAALLLFAQHFLWTAHAEEIRTAWPRLLELARALPAGAEGAPEQTVALIACALSQLALAAESLGRAEQAVALRTAAAPLARGAEMAGVLAMAAGWAQWADGAAAGAFRAWHMQAESGLGPARALWPGPAGPDDASAAARVIGAFAYGMLGIEADAPRGRLRLRPQLPEQWERVAVQHLRVGDAEVAFSCVVSEGMHRFEIEQLTGAVPLRLVFEPAVPGTVGPVRVDGAPASLGLRAWGERTLVPVQLVLDDRRRVDIAAKRAAERKHQVGA